MNSLEPRSDYNYSQEDRSVSCNQSQSSEKRKCKKDEIKYTLKKREMRNLESYQQAVLLTLINSICSFTLEHPGKQSKVTATMPRLVSLNVDNEEIEVAKLADKQSQLVMKNEIANGLSQATALRRFEKNKRIFTQNFLFDLCIELGFWFESKPSRKSKKSQQMERITSIYYKGSCLMNQKEMMDLGDSINSFFFSKVVNDKQVTFLQNNLKLNEIKESSGIRLC